MPAWQQGMFCFSKAFKTDEADFQVWILMVFTG
jgi:hypothetical protein